MIFFSTCVVIAGHQKYSIKTFLIIYFFNKLIVKQIYLLCQAIKNAVELLMQPTQRKNTLNPAFIAIYYQHHHDYFYFYLQIRQKWQEIQKNGRKIKTMECYNSVSPLLFIM